MITKDGRDTAIEKLSAENYIVPKGEEKDYHCVIEVVQYDPKTGKKISKPRVQKFGRKTFENTVLASLRKQGYEVKILHDPNQWFAKQQKAAAEKAKEAEELKKKQEEEKFQKAVQEEVAKQLAKMQRAAAEKAANGEKPSGDTGEAPETAQKPAKKGDK